MNARSRGRAGAWAVGLSLLASARWARAHEVGLSRGDYAVEGASVRADVIFARKELIGLVATLDENHDGALTQPEIDAARDAIAGALVGRIKVKGDGVPCAGAIERAELAEQDGVAVRARYRCAERPREVTVELAFLEDVAFGHRHLARVNAAGGPLDVVASQRAPSFSFAAPSAPPGADAGPTPRDADGSPLRRGALHVATAWELPAFFVGLVVARADRARAAALSAAAFVGSVVLGLVLSGLAVFAPSPRAVAAAIASSLVYVGVDDLADASPRSPWIAVPFGVVHGLGCGAAFHLAAGSLAGFSLAAFAIGVAAACAVLIVALPAILWVRATLPARGAAAVSAAILIAGVVDLARQAR